MVLLIGEVIGTLRRSVLTDSALMCCAFVFVALLVALSFQLWNEHPEIEPTANVPAILATLSTLAAGVFAIVTLLHIRSAKRAAHSLLERYREMFEDNPEPMWIFDDETLVFLDVNRAATLRYGYSKNEFLQMSVLDIRPKQEIGQLLANVRAPERSRHTDGPWHHMAKSGRIFPVEVTSMPLESEGRAARFVLARDVSEKLGAQEAQEQLRQATELIQAVFHTAPLAVWGLDINGLVTFWNRTAEKWFGWTEEEVIGQRLPVIPQAQQHEFEEWLIRYRDGFQLKGEERSRVRKDGTTIECAIWSAPLRDASGSITGTVGIVADVTERSQAEEELRKHMERLAASNEDLQQFAYAASHDLQEPLRDLLVCTQMFERLFSGVASEQAYEYLQFARKGALTMRALVGGLGEYWRLDQQPLELQVFSLNVAAERAVTRLRESIAAQGAKVYVEELPLIKGDSELMETLFVHLLDNALKFRSAVPPVIHVSAHIAPQQCTISVADNGIGIDVRFAQRVMKIFNRLSRDYAGVGMGLSLCKKIVDRHNGVIELERNEAGGTTVKIYLQIATGVAARAVATEGLKSASR